MLAGPTPGDVSFIYPISPSTSMGETMDKFATAGRKNVFGQTVKAQLGARGPRCWG